MAEAQSKIGTATAVAAAALSLTSARTGTQRCAASENTGRATSGSSYVEAVRSVVRSHRPAPTLDVQIEYDAGADRDERGPYSWFHISDFRVGGRDIEPKLRKALGEDKFARLEAVIEETMREAREAQHAAELDGDAA